jgi:hypothetical protein
MRASILWLLRPLFRRKLKRLEKFSGPETYTDQMKRNRLIAMLRSCLTY